MSDGPMDLDILRKLIRNYASALIENLLVREKLGVSLDYRKVAQADARSAHRRLNAFIDSYDPKKRKPVDTPRPMSRD